MACLVNLNGLWPSLDFYYFFLIYLFIVSITMATLERFFRSLQPCKPKDAQSEC